MKKIAVLMGCMIALIGAGLYAAAHYTTGAPSDGKMKVTASFYPMAEFTRQVGGTYVTVATLVKPGTEPHDYEPTPQDIATIYKSKVLVTNGAGLERWATKLQGDLQANHILSLEAVKGVALHTNVSTDSTDQTPTDPHVWMAPALAIYEVNNIRDSLIQADPAHRSAYQANARAYTAKLQALDDAFRGGLQQCELNTIVTSHQAFSYLAAAYGLTSEGIAGLSPDDEPSPRKLAQIADYVKEQRITHIFFETLVSPKLAQTIARETGAAAIAFNPLEGLTSKEVAQGKNYLSVQKENLQALRTALHCQ